MRQGELIRLCWEHIDLNRRTAHLPDTKNVDSSLSFHLTPRFESLYDP